MIETNLVTYGMNTIITKFIWYFNCLSADFLSATMSGTVRSFT